MGVLSLQSASLAIVSLFLVAVVLRLARKGLLTFRYTAGWLVFLLLGALSSVFLQLSEPVSSLVGVTPGVIVLGAGVVLLLAICIQLSISISVLQQNLRVLAENSAILDRESRWGKPDRGVLVIVPAFNEEGTVGDICQDLLKLSFEVLVIDDGSTDRTRARALAAGAQVLSMPFNSGVGGALRAGLRYAVRNGYGTVVQCDADGQHPIPHIRELLAALDSGDCDMVIGSRFATGQAEHMHVGALRRFAMWTLASSASRAVGGRITDVTSGFRAWRGQLLFALADHLPAYYLGDTYEAVIAAGRAGYRVKEIPSPIGERLHGTSSASPLQAARLTARAFATAVLHLHVRLPARR